MKITYPECQVEITAEEFITVIDHFTTKVTCNIEPTFEPGGIVGTGDDMPKPKPYPNLTDHEAIIPRQDVGGPISSVRFNIGKPNPYPTKEVPTPVESTKSRQHDSTKKSLNL